MEIQPTAKRFSGNIGQLINKVTSLPFSKEISQLDTVVEIIYLENEVVN